MSLSNYEKEKIQNNLTEEQKNILKQDILDRYNNEEYWDYDILEYNDI